MVQIIIIAVCVLQDIYYWLFELFKRLYRIINYGKGCAWYSLCGCHIKIAVFGYWLKCWFT